MSDRYGSYPPDEPVIGGSVPPSNPRQPRPGIGYAPGPGDNGYYDDGDEAWDDDAYADDDYDYDDGYADPYYDDEYYGEAPARQPIFYLFVAMAVLVGAAAIVLLFSLVRSDGGGNEAGTPGPTQFRVSIESPENGERVNIGEVTDVNVRATSTDPISRFELLVNGRVADQVAATPPASGDVYIAVLKAQFDRKGEYEIAVKVIAESGDETTSDAIRVSAVEDIGDRPVRILGKVVASATLRTGPGDQFEDAGTLNAGQEVTIIGRTRSNEWLLLDLSGGRWVRADAIEPLDPLELVPVREPTPTPAPTNTPEPLPTPTPSVTPTPTTNPNAPDFVPTNAVLVDGGQTLRVTIANLSPNNFSGSLVVSANGVEAVSPTQAFGVTLEANGSVTVDFELAEPITSQRTATVRVDPDNAVKEANEDNNGATFPLTPPVEPPSLVLSSPVINDSSVTVTLQNNGGDLPSSDVVVQLTLGNETTQVTDRISLASGQTREFTVTRPAGTGTARIIALVNGQQMAAVDIQIGP